MDARVRPATTADLYWLRLLLGQLVDEVGDTAYPYIRQKDLEPILAGMAARLAKGDLRLLVYVAEHDAVIGGMVVGELGERPGIPSPYMGVPYLYVVPQWRQTSVGRMLSTFIAAEAQRRGARAVEFLARPDDHQWADRGWPVAAIVHALPIEAALASIVPTHASNGHGLSHEEAS